MAASELTDPCLPEPAEPPPPSPMPAPTPWPVLQTDRTLNRREWEVFPPPGNIPPTRRAPGPLHVHHPEAGHHAPAEVGPSVLRPRCEPGPAGGRSRGRGGPWEAPALLRLGPSPSLEMAAKLWPA